MPSTYTHCQSGVHTIYSEIHMINLSKVFKYLYSRCVTVVETIQNAKSTIANKVRIVNYFYVQVHFVCECD